MTKRSRGLFNGRTRHLARHHNASTLSISAFIKDFKVGDKVAIVPKGNKKNIPHPRYRGKIGRVIEKRGNSYMVVVKAMTTEVHIIVPSLHLEKAL
jgi:large subunit ribosomal protein L21e